MSAFLDVHNFMASKLAWQEAIIKDKDLSPVARLIACQMMHDLHSERRRAWRSQEAIAALIGVDVRTVRRALAALVAAGYLKTTVSHGRGHANLYEALFQRVNLPEENRTQVSSYRPENRTLLSEKPDTAAPPYLEINPITPLTPQEAVTGDDSASPSDPLEAQWAAFEAAYPLNHATSAGWRRARSAFEGIVQAGQASPQVLIAAAAAYAKARAGQSPDRTKAPQHWLREDRWRDRAAANCNNPRTGFASTFADADIRSALVGAMTEAGVASYLDPAAWRASDRTIVCRLTTAQQRLTERAGRLLKSLGVRVIVDATEHALLMSSPAMASAA